MKSMLLTFDLDTRAAEKMFGNRGLPYSRLENFLFRFGFRREQGSAFLNTSGMTPAEQSAFLQAMADELPWLMKIASDVKLREVANDICVVLNPRQYKFPF